jgi:Zinc carboxypeptidase
MVNYNFVFICFELKTLSLGYEHSRAVDRMWRQNRRQVTPTCVGVDINRNFGYSWRAATITQPVRLSFYDIFI